MKFREAKNKGCAKLVAVFYDHVMSFVTVLKQLQSDYLEIFDSSDRVINADKKSALGELGKISKFLCPQIATMVDVELLQLVGIVCM